MVLEASLALLGGPPQTCPALLKVKAALTYRVLLLTLLVVQAALPLEACALINDTCASVPTMKVQT